MLYIRCIPDSRKYPLLDSGFIFLKRAFDDCVFVFCGCFFQSVYILIHVLKWDDCKNGEEIFGLIVKLADENRVRIGMK